jgi:hypothetical protein
MEKSTTMSARPRWVLLLLRAILCLVLVACLDGAAREGIGAMFARRGTADGIRRAEIWDSGNPEYPAESAHLVAAKVEGAEPLEMVRDLEDSTRLGPDRAIHWANLAEAYELAERILDARRAYERAVGLFPKSPQINWEFANFLIRNGDAASAAGPLREAILGDPLLRVGAFDIAWRAGMPAERVLQIVPDQQDTLSAYLDYLIRAGRLDAAPEVWQRLMASSEPFDTDAAYRYFDALISAHRVDALMPLWGDLSRRDPAKFQWRAGDANLIQNGGFEGPMLNGGFGWRTLQIEGVTVSLDSRISYDGTQSAAVRFDGKHNLGFANLMQYVAVEPLHSYRFVAYARTNGITTDSGPRIAIYDPFDRGALALETENLLGSSDWAEQRLDFRTGAGTKLIVVQIVRPPSGKLDNQIAGTLWLDDVSLTANP